MRIKSYSSYLNSMAGLIGVQVADLSTADLTIINSFFNKSMKYIWQQTAWVDVCPFSEARFIGNLVKYPNNYSATGGNYTPSGTASVTDNSLANPLDARVTAALMTENSATSTHKIVSDTFSAIPLTTYSFSLYVRPNGRNYGRLALTDTATYSAYFNFTGGGSVVSMSNCAANIAQAPNGFYIVQIIITSSATATTISSEFDLSADGITNSYAGNGTAGAYIWGWYLGAATNTPLNMVLPWEQYGEEQIDVVFNAWCNPSVTLNSPRRIGYKQVDNGIQVINSGLNNVATYYNQTPQTASGPITNPPLSVIYIYYRKRVPDYSGAAYSAATAYTVGQQMYYTNSAGNGDYWQNIVATTAGQNPDTNPNSWKLLSIPFVFFDYAVYDSFASWLMTEGQFGKAAGMLQLAQDLMDREADRQERSMGIQEPMKVRTHLTSRPMATR
jgi:hypothetical protein